VELRNCQIFFRTGKGMTILALTCMFAIRPKMAHTVVHGSVTTYPACMHMLSTP
jgi:hypothetical protein